jgi:hypothetical protein
MSELFSGQKSLANGIFQVSAVSHLYPVLHAIVYFYITAVLILVPVANISDFTQRSSCFLRGGIVESNIILFISSYLFL